MARKFEDDDLLHVADTVVEKSDRLAREYQKEREIRARKSSVRLLDDEPRRSKSTRSRPSEPARKSSSRPTAKAPPAPAPAPARNEPAEAKPRRELPHTPPIAPEVTVPARTTIDLLAMELDAQLREARFSWRTLRGADKLTLICSFFMAAGVFLPWRSDPAHSLQIGLMSGGAVHLALAALASALVVRSAKLTAMRNTLNEMPGYGRTSLWLVLCGAASTGVGAYLLLLVGLEKAPDWAVDIHFGLYWTLVSGTGVSYGGFARFSALRSSSQAS